MPGTVSSGHAPAPAPAPAPSPSPPPAPPVAETPGPRASKLQTLFSNALTHTLKTCSYANFSACFPTPAKHVPESLQALWKQMNARIEEFARREFEAIMRERDVVRNLNELDRLVGEARKRKERGEMGEGDVPPHTLPPQALYLAHLAPYLAQAQSTLNAKLQTTQSQNAQLMEKITEQRAEIERLVGGLEGVVRDLEEAKEAVGAVFEDGTLAREVLDIDAELRTVQ